jgi:acetate kinase
MNAHRIKKYIGSYAAVLNGLDAIVFYFAGIGENSSYIRRCAPIWSIFELYWMHSKNEIRSKEIREINAADQQKFLVVPTMKK